MSKPKSSEELLAYARHLITEWRRSGRTDASLADALSRSGGFVSQFASKKVGMGLDTLRRLADVHGMTLDQFEAAAHAHATGEKPTTESHVEYDERYPNRAKAVQAARLVGYAESAIETVNSMALKGEDLPPAKWLEFIKSFHEQVELGLPPRLPGVPVSDEGTVPLPPPPRKPTKR